MRIFVPEERLELWLAERDGEWTEDRRAVRVARGYGASLQRSSKWLTVEPAVHVLRESSEGQDAYDLVGKVKKHADILSLGGEFCPGAVLFSEHAYDVVEGFVLEAAVASLPASPRSEDLDAWARLFLHTPLA